jgi:hypothetical protein
MFTVLFGGPRSPLPEHQSVKIGDRGNGAAGEASDMDGKAEEPSERERTSQSADKIWLPGFLLS